MNHDPEKLLAVAQKCNAELVTALRDDAGKTPEPLLFMTLVDNVLDTHKQPYQTAAMLAAALLALEKKL